MTDQKKDRPDLRVEDGGANEEAEITLEGSSEVPEPQNDAPEEIDWEREPAPPPPDDLNTHPEVVEIYISLDRRNGRVGLKHPNNLVTTLGVVAMAQDMMLMRLKGVPMGGNQSPSGIVTPPKGFDPRRPH